VNAKFEARMSKSETIFKGRMIENLCCMGEARVLNFAFVSSFEIRISEL